MCSGGGFRGVDSVGWFRRYVQVEAFLWVIERLVNQLESYQLQTLLNSISLETGFTHYLLNIVHIMKKYNGFISDKTWVSIKYS